MNEQTVALLIFGGAVVAFAFFASHMADRQKNREKHEAKHRHHVAH